MDPKDFRDLMSNFPTGVTVVTANAPTADAESAVPGGIAIGSFFSVSLEPLLVGFCVGSSSSSWATIKEAKSFCVNILGADQLALCGQMAGKGDKFAGVEYTEAPVTGSPVLPGIIGFLDCVHETTYAGGDHDIVIGRVVAVTVSDSDADPMVFFRRQYGTFAAPGVE